MRLLLDVDVQNDFADPAGALFVPRTQLAPYARLIRAAVSERWPIVGSVDSHAFDAWEFASSGKRGPDGAQPNFPDHCVKGSWGWLKPTCTLPPHFRFVPNQIGAEVTLLGNELLSGVNGALYFEKEVYSLFANPNAEPLLEVFARRSPTPLEFLVFGLATDYCVKAAALGLRERGYHAVVVSDAVWGITEEGTQAALAEMAAAGCRFATLSELGIRELSATGGAA